MTLNISSQMHYIGQKCIVPQRHLAFTSEHPGRQEATRHHTLFHHQGNKKSHPRKIRVA